MSSTKKLVMFGRMLKKVRDAVGMSQAAVAAKVGCSQSLIAQLEGGGFFNPQSEFLKALSELYQVSYRDLIAVFVHDRYGVDFTTGELPRNPLITLLEKELSDLRGDAVAGTS